MNTHDTIQLIPAEPVITRISVFEQRLAQLEKENQELRHQQPEQRHTTREGACQQLGIKFTKLHELITDGHLAKVKVGRRTLVTQDSIDRFLAIAATKKSR